MSVVVAGGVAQNAHYGGHVWVFLQYLLGFRRLGFDVLLIDRLEPSIGRGGDAETSPQLRSLVEVMRRFDLAESYAVFGQTGEVIAGRSRAEVLEHVRRSALLLNVMGFLDDDEILAAAPKRVFLDIDPGFGQMWHELGLADVFAGHEYFVTVATEIGDPQCEVPTCGLEWIPIPPPIVLQQWPEQSGGDRRFAVVGAWRGLYGPVEYRGKSYGLRVHEFRKFAPLPRRTGFEFEAALDIDPSETRDIELLRENGWRLVDPEAVAGDPWRYRRYVQRAGAEIMIAKGMYVETRSGWVSDRSVCFLASGRPVLAQDTGFAATDGEGFVPFTTLEDAVEGSTAIVRDYPRHARAARALAENVFSSDIVLRELLRRLAIE